jgi:hypothetical protein
VKEVRNVLRFGALVCVVFGLKLTVEGADATRLLIMETALLWIIDLSRGPEL